MSALSSSQRLSTCFHGCIWREQVQVTSLRHIFNICFLVGQVWEQHDADRDGWLTEEQLYTALRSAGIRLRKKEKHELRRELEDEL